MESKEVQTLSIQEKAISLFSFIKELNKLKQKVILNIRDYPWYCAVSDIPAFPEYVRNVFSLMDCFANCAVIRSGV